MDKRSALVYRAKLAEMADRADDMTKIMKKVVMLDGNLSVDERNLFSVGYKNVVGSSRNALRRCHSDENNNDELRRECAKQYRKVMETEVRDVSQGVLDLLNKLIKPDLDCESKVFYYKMKGDYYRYIAESSEKEDRLTAAKKSKEAYEEATKEATKENGLAPTHPVRLGLALNFSVFYYEIEDQPVPACQHAKAAFDEALGELEQLSEDSYKDSTLIMQLLRDNLTLWTSEQDGEEEAKDGQGEKA